VQLVTFRVDGNLYGVDARKVVAVVPCVALHAVPHAPELLRGLLRYRGTVLPVLDLGVLLGTPVSHLRLSTRVLLVEYLRDGRQAILGLLAEQVSDLMDISHHHVAFPAVDLGGAPSLGPILEAGETLVQVISVDRIVPDTIKDALFPPVGEPS
jgi:chemotaxis-related protein WspB